jgi:hypothetical protein
MNIFFFSRLFRGFKRGRLFRGVWLLLVTPLLLELTRAVTHSFSTHTHGLSLSPLACFTLSNPVKRSVGRSGRVNCCLAFARTVIPGFEFRKTHDHILLSHDSGSRATPPGFSYMTKSDYVTLETKLIVAQYTTAGPWVSNKNKIHSNSKANFDKLDTVYTTSFILIIYKHYPDHFLSNTFKNSHLSSYRNCKLNCWWRFNNDITNNRYWFINPRRNTIN